MRLFQRLEIHRSCRNCLGTGGRYLEQAVFETIPFVLLWRSTISLPLLPNSRSVIRRLWSSPDTKPQIVVISVLSWCYVVVVLEACQSSVIAAY